MFHFEKKIWSRVLTALMLLVGCVAPALATNGMLMEGYGPVSTAMGGASQAIDHGNAGMAQNPATLGLMADGTSRLDIAAGVLGPNVQSSIAGMTVKSSSDFYLMPAVGYVKRQGAFTYGLGVFAQGGMGTEYDATSFLAMGSGGIAHSELGVGNVLLPVAYQVNSDLAVGATLKFIWSQLDVAMAVPGGALQQGAGLVTGATGALAGATSAGSPMLSAPWARIAFTDDNRYTGTAKATGFGATLGATFRLSPQVLLGASYQFKTALDDMKTGSVDTTLAMPGFTDHGQMTVINFQMPAVFAVGASWQVKPSLLLAADLKYIGWADSMKNFMMRYDSAQGMGSASFTLDQNWKDQTVLNLGAAWAMNDALTLRGGVNLSENPVPDSTVNPLFPAIVRNHLMLGFGYKLSKTGEINASLTLAPSVAVTSAQGVEISHGQTNLQLMYSHRF